MKKLTLLCLVALPTLLLSQSGYVADALKYSQNDLIGTARGLGVAGAFGSVGADLTSLSSNPAGIALYRSSEAVFSPSVIHSKTNGNFLNSITQGETARFYINNAGAVFAKPNNSDNGKKFKGGAFAVSFNRLANFNNEVFLDGRNSNNSVTDSYVEELTGIPGFDVSNDVASFESVMAYQAWLVNEVDFVGNYRTPVQGTINQSVLWDTRGGLDELSLAFAGNYNHKVYFGASLAFPILAYDSELRISESDADDNIPVFESMDQTSFYEANGFGFNAKFGLIIRPENWIRIGAAIHTPNWINVTEEYRSTLSSEFDTVGYSFNSPFGLFEYDLRLPWRFTSGVSFYIKKSGFISFDYELADYTANRYDFGPQNQQFESEVNTEMGDIYRMASTFRVGGEFAKDILRLRAGYAYSMSPFKKNIAFPGGDYSRQYYTAGLGVKIKKFSADFAYVRSHTKEYYAPYTLSDSSEPFAINEVNRDNIVFTFGYRF